jgi:hypothetical protein
MPIVAELVDAVGGDTHRDTHTLEMVTPVGVTIATLAIDNDERNRGVRAMHRCVCLVISLTTLRPTGAAIKSGLAAAVDP